VRVVLSSSSIRSPSVSVQITIAELRLFIAARRDYREEIIPVSIGFYPVSFYRYLSELWRSFLPHTVRRGSEDSWF